MTADTAEIRITLNIDCKGVPASLVADWLEAGDHDLQSYLDATAEAERGDHEASAEWGVPTIATMRAEVVESISTTSTGPANRSPAAFWSAVDDAKTALTRLMAWDYHHDEWVTLQRARNLLNDKRAQGPS